MTELVSEFSDIRDEFLGYVSDIVYSTMITVDRDHRPRARVLILVWEVSEGRPVGWLATYRTPVKAAHLARNPHTTFAYWSPRQNAAFVDSLSRWVGDPDTKQRIWELYRTGSPPGVGYDMGHYWRGGATDPTYHLLRVDPWRIQVVRGADLRSRSWQTTPPRLTPPQTGAPTSQNLSSATHE